jgi:hypothetical protein
MKRLHVLGLMLAVTSSLAFAQYRGKYVGWSTGYLFTGSLNAKHYNAFTHICDFGATASSSGTCGSGRGTSFVSTCHTNGVKAILCIGGQGNSSAFSSACATAAGMTKLVSNILKAAKAGGYDGVDMDWEEGEESGFDGNATKVAMFGAFHKMLRDSIDAHTPRLIYTAALTFDWYPKGSQAAAQWIDQANSMTYYDPVSRMGQLLGASVLGSIPKTRVGVGFGWDTDNEITDPADILAKCRYAIDNGFGGIMAWHISRAQTVTSWILDSIAHYVTHTPTDVLPTPAQRYAAAKALEARYNAMTRLGEISYTVMPSAAGAAFVDLGVYDLKGALVKTLVHGYSAPGCFVVPLATCGTGAYILRLTMGPTSEAALISNVK